VLPDLSSLGPLFSNPKIEKIFHAAEYDLICLKRSFSIQVSGIFDTMQAGRMLGYRQVGLDAMLLEKMGITHNKKYQKADWGMRPLTDEMLSYARLDTHYLLDLRDHLSAELKQEQRWELAQEEFRRLARGSENSKEEPQPWQRVKGVQHFNDRQITILQELCDWREHKASQMDRPIFKVIDNNRLANIVKNMPVSMEQLESDGLTSRQVKAYGHDLLEALQRGKSMPLLHRPRQKRPDHAQVERAKALSAWRRRTAVKWGIESDLILPKNWMITISEKNPKTLKDLAGILEDSPWRLEHFGLEILKILNGNE
jgi:ribonuclease D